MTFLEGCCHVSFLREAFLPAHELDKKRPQGLPMLAAKHVNLQFQLGVQRARSSAASADLGASASNRSRPAWAHRGCARSGQAGGRASTCSAESRMGRFEPNAWADAWRSLTSEWRQDYGSRANMFRVGAETPLDAYIDKLETAPINLGPWGMGVP